MTDDETTTGGYAAMPGTESFSLTPIQTEPDSPREQALADVRDALAAAESIPVAGVDEQKAATVRDVVDGLVALEKQLTNEVEQLQDETHD
jgi:hypothetical protein